MQKLMGLVRRCVDDYHMIEAGDRVAVGVSGGKDSLTLLVVLVACQLDKVMGSSFIRDAAIIGFMANEAISIIENAGLMGVPIPETITQAVDVLWKKGKEERK